MVHFFNARICKTYLLLPSFICLRQYDDKSCRIWIKLFYNFRAKSEAFMIQWKDFFRIYTIITYQWALAEMRKEHLEEIKTHRQEATRKQIKLRSKNHEKSGSTQETKSCWVLNKDMSIFISNVLIQKLKSEITHLYNAWFNIIQKPTNKSISEKLQQAIFEQN